MSNERSVRRAVARVNESVLGDHVSLQRGTTYKSRLLGQPGPILLGLATIGRDGGFRSDSLQTYGGDSPNKLKLVHGDLYVSLKDVTQSGDLLGSVARVPAFVSAGRVTQDTVKLIPKSGSSSLAYLYWVLRTPDYRCYCRERGMGTTNLSLSRDDFLSYPIPPESDERKSIVELLEAIEQMIDVNQRMNQTLEAIAHALFKSWFVDFDPVAAQREGRRQSGIQAKTAAVFPAHFVESDLGPIPKGWEWRLVKDVIEINPRRQLPQGAVAPYVGMRSLPIQGHAPMDWEFKAAGSGARFMNGDTLMARITPCLENGKTAYVDFLDDGQVAWGSTEYLVLRPRSPIPPVYGYLLARSEDFREHAIRSMTGSSGRQRVAVDDLGRYVVAEAPRDVFLAFAEIVEPLFELATQNMRATREMLSLRDSLLPELLSGEIRFKDAETAIGKAV